VSVRSWKEHVGEVSGYNYIGPAGRIAGDVWGNVRVGRVPHAALPQRGQHDARVP
jgi:hypothetical protein